jgi:hypothetical protein
MVLVIIFQSVNQNIPNPTASTKNRTEWCRKTRGKVYIKNHCIPLIAIDGVELLSYPPCGVIEDNQ